MKPSQFEKALNLVRKTGMGMVIMDEAQAYVLTTIDDFEGRISAVKPKEKNIWDVMPEAGKETETWDPEALSDAEMKDLEAQYKAFAQKTVEETVAEKEPESKPEPKKPEDFGEEEFYLEPVD